MGNRFSSPYQQIQDKTTDYTVLPGDDVIRVTNTAIATITLYDPNKRYGEVGKAEGDVMIQNLAASTHPVVVATAAGAIVGQFVLSPGQSARFRSDGVASWINFGATPNVHFAEIALTNAEIKALRATPKTLVPAPGTGRVLQLLGGSVILDAGTNALTESTANLGVKYTDGSGVQASQTIEATGFIDQTADTMTSILPKLDTIVAKSGCENKALVLHNLGAGEFGGNAALDALLRVKIQYAILNTGW